MQRIDVRLALETSDNGKGIEAEAIVDPKFLGLLGMMKQVRPFRNSVKLRGTPGRGTRVSVAVPVEESPA